jgi:hypothetical protein
MITIFMPVSSWLPAGMISSRKMVAHREGADDLSLPLPPAIGEVGIDNRATVAGQSLTQKG